MESAAQSAAPRSRYLSCYKCYHPIKQPPSFRAVFYFRQIPLITEVKVVEILEVKTIF